DQWNVHGNVRSFYRKEVGGLFTGYYRDLMQNQPRHIEIVAEKLTLQSIISPVASEFCIPLLIGRGQCSTSPLYELSQRYRNSGKGGLVLLLLGDLDPDGDAIAHSVASRLKYDFDIEHFDAVKVALTM